MPRPTWTHARWPNFRGQKNWGYPLFVDTEILLSRTYPQIRPATFTRQEEAKVGADWLWWWVAPGGESFGMIAQAKRLDVNETKWRFNFDYKSGEQRRALCKAADLLDIVPVYSLYLGTQRYRWPANCGSGLHDAKDCENCAKLAVSLLPALLAKNHVIVDADSTYKHFSLRWRPSSAMPRSNRLW